MTTATAEPKEEIPAFEQIREVSRSQKETNWKICHLGDRWYDFTDDLIASNLFEKVNEMGYGFYQISQNHEINDEQNHVKTQIDIQLEDNDYVMVVEAVPNLTKADVKEHLERMEALRRYADARGDKRKFVSSVAGALIEDGARKYALEQGLYVIEHPGQTIEIIAPPKRREW